MGILGLYARHAQASVKTILVGNGGSLASLSLGNHIDSFDRVIRFNEYRTKGFEHQVGTKTDLVIVNEGYLKGQLKLEDPTKPVMLSVPWYKRTEGCLWSRLFYNTNLLINSESSCRRICHYYRDANYWPSTGLLALAHFLELGPCDVLGLDHFIFHQHHYFDNNTFHAHHNAALEIRITKLLLTHH